MKRRKALKLMSGAAVIGLTSGGILSLSSCAGEGIDWVPKFFTEEEAFVVHKIVDMIMPRTDTPGAVDVGVPAAMDQYFAEIWDAERQQKLRSRLTTAMTNFEVDNGVPFAKAKDDLRMSWLKAKIAEKDTDENKLIGTLKWHTIEEYFGSKVIGTEYLAYDPVPGRQQGCVPLEEATGGVMWSLGWS